MPDLCFQPAYALREQLLGKQLSARELLTEFETHISSYNPAINALVTLDFEQAYRMAKQADDQLMCADYIPGPLHGLPLAVKDIFHVVGMSTTFGNLLFRDHISTYDDLLVQREKAGGAVIIGKSNTPDCASGGVTRNEVFGLTRNPWNREKTTSGSGGGGAAAIATGLVSIADGSDVGGSARSPAAWTNCVGFRPTSGRIPDIPGSIADGSISTAGVFTRTVADVALFMQAVDGPNLHSAVDYPTGSPGLALQALNTLPAGKVGWVTDFSVDCADDIARCMHEARRTLESMGVEVETVDIGLGDAFKQLARDNNACAVTRGLPKEVLAACMRGEPTKPAIQATVEHYLSLSALDIQQIWLDVAQLKVRMQRLMAEYPLLICPTHTQHAFAVDAANAEDTFDWMTLYLAPMLGLPSVSVPAGFTDDGMPFGMMISGRYGEDKAVLRLAAGFERETEYYKLRPDLSGVVSKLQSTQHI